MSLVALSELLGATVRDASGTVRGRVREIAVAPQDHPTRIAYLIVKTADGERMLPAEALRSAGVTVRAVDDSAGWVRFTPSDGVLLLKRDLLVYYGGSHSYHVFVRWRPGVVSPGHVH